MSVAIVYLIFSISLHACSGRRLGFFDKEETVRSLQLPHKRVEPILPAQRLMNSKENLRAEVETRKILPPSTNIGATTMQPKNFEASEEDKKDNKGKEVILPVTEELLQKTAEIQDRKRQARLMIESPPADNAEETMVSKENDMGEDIVVMDYAQPHRKPPIHNKEP